MAKLNLLALARRDPGLMTALVPHEGYTFVGRDLLAAEPSITSHLSEDTMYYYSSFGGAGKRPFYQDGVLWIDDTYLMAGSCIEVFRKELYDFFKNPENLDQWVKDPEVCKSQLKGLRKNLKWICLAFSYGMGPKKLVKQGYDSGFLITEDQARNAYKSYWRLFEGVQEYARHLSQLVEEHKYLVNPFGYRITPEPHKAFNYMIQSSVSGLLHWFCKELFSTAKYAKFVTVYHDELIAEVPDDRLEDYRKDTDKVLRQINDELKWIVDIRMGWAQGKNLYDCK